MDTQAKYVPTPETYTAGGVERETATGLYRIHDFYRTKKGELGHALGAEIAASGKVLIHLTFAGGGVRRYLAEHLKPIGDDYQAKPLEHRGAFSRRRKPDAAVGGEDSKRYVPLFYRVIDNRKIGELIAHCGTEVMILFSDGSHSRHSRNDVEPLSPDEMMNVDPGAEHMAECEADRPMIDPVQRRSHLGHAWRAEGQYGTRRAHPAGWKVVNGHLTPGK